MYSHRVNVKHQSALMILLAYMLIRAPSRLFWEVLSHNAITAQIYSFT